jgi:hypothetical protein
MKTFNIVTTLLMALILATSATAAQSNPCENVSIEWMQQHVPIPQPRSLPKLQKGCNDIECLHF